MVGGTLDRDAPSYLPRRADEDLYRALRSGNFCYVLTPRQMGKSSLMVRTAARIRAEGGIAAVLDLTEIGQNLTVEQWYKGLLNIIGEDLGFEDDLTDVWREHRDLGPMQRWMKAVREVVLARTTGAVVIFIDEIDAVRSLPFSTDEFFAGIRELYNKRAEHEDLGRLTFCLLGVAAPSDLIRDTRTTPFNIGQRVELDDFTLADAAPLSQGLGREAWQGELLLERVLYWTGGHPYLTQRLCRAIAEDDAVQDEDDVNRLCDELFLSPKARDRDDNLLFVRDRLLRSEVDLAGLLELYRDVRDGKRIADDETNPLITVLKLSGVVRVMGGELWVRNRIYQSVFSRQWVAENLPGAEVRRQRQAFKQGLGRAAVVGIVIVALMSVLVLDAWRQRSSAERSAKVAEEQKTFAERERGLNRRLLYVAHINLAYQAWARGDFSRATEILQDEAPDNDNQDIRSFEFYYLWRLCHAERMTLNIANPVAAVSYSPDGKTLAVGAIDGRLTLWRADTGQLDREFERGLAAIPSVSFSPDGRRLAASYADGNVRIFDLASGKSTLLRAHGFSPVYVTFSPDGAYLATGSADRTVKLWRTDRLELETTFTGFTDWVGRVVFSPDGSTIAAGSGSGVVKLFSVRDRRELATFFDHIGFVRALAFSPDGGTLLTGGADGRLVFRTLDSGAKPVVVKAYPDGVLSVAFSPDGRRFAVGSASGVLGIWDTALRGATAVFTGHLREISMLEFSPDGTSIASASFDTTVKQWDVDHETKDFSVLRGHQEAVYGLGFSPDGHTLASASFDHTVRLWNADTETNTAVLRGHEDHLRAVAFSPDGRLLVTGSDDRTVRVWDVASSQTVKVLTGFNNWVSDVAFSPDGALLAAVSFDGSVRVWDTENYVEKAVFRSDGGALECMAFSPDGKLLAAGGEDKVVYVWDLASGTLQKTLTGHEDWVNALAFSSDGTHLATTGSFLDATIRIWRTDTFEVEHVLKGLGGNSGVAEQAIVGRLGRANDVAFSPDGATLAAVTVDANLKLYDVVSGQEYGTPLTGHSGRVYAVAFTKDGTMLATASEDSTVRLLRAATLEKVASERCKGYIDSTSIVANAQF